MRSFDRTPWHFGMFDDDFIRGLFNLPKDCEIPDEWEIALIDRTRQRFAVTTEKDIITIKVDNIATATNQPLFNLRMHFGDGPTLTKPTLEDQPHE